MLVGVTGATEDHLANFQVLLSTKPRPTSEQRRDFRAGFQKKAFWGRKSYLVSVFYKLFHWQIKDGLRQGLGVGGAGEAVERKGEGQGQIQQGCVVSWTGGISGSFRVGSLKRMRHLRLEE